MVGLPMPLPGTQAPRGLLQRYRHEGQDRQRRPEPGGNWHELRHFRQQLHHRRIILNVCVVQTPHVLSCSTSTTSPSRSIFLVLARTCKVRCGWARICVLATDTSFICTLLPRSSLSPPGNVTPDILEWNAILANKSITAPTMNAVPNWRKSSASNGGN